MGLTGLIIEIVKRLPHPPHENGGGWKGHRLTLTKQEATA